jgi:predicted lysophospholipase L1 biosynthesis ABC-type transport system permease subunit
VVSPIVRENLRHNLAHTSAKILAIAIEVTIVLSLVGIRQGIGMHPSMSRLIVCTYASALLLFAFMVSFFFMTIGRYSEVSEMTREIGILRVLGASTGYLLKLLYQETLLLTVLGMIAGIIMTYGARWFVAKVFPKLLTLETVYAWWPIAGAISAAGPLFGAAMALRGAVRQGVVEALGAEE